MSTLATIIGLISLFCSVWALVVSYYNRKIFKQLQQEQDDYDRSMIERAVALGAIVGPGI